MGVGGEGAWEGGEGVWEERWVRERGREGERERGREGEREHRNTGRRDAKGGREGCERREHRNTGREGEEGSSLTSTWASVISGSEALVLRGRS
jgi:hypothetical protein